MKYLWSKSADQPDSNEAIQRFMSGNDLLLDRQLFAYDIVATRAHAMGLEKIGILTPEELTQIESALDQLENAFAQGQFQLEPPMEDSHTAIEFWLTEQLGEIGEKVHTGRSRNDQVQVAMRLFLRDQLADLFVTCLNLAEAFLARAQRDEKTPMPGYTHLQRAVPSSVGLWLSSFAESFADIADLTRFTRQWINSCPLGTAAGFGVNLPLERQLVAQQLNFPRLQMNPMYVQNSRGRFEIQSLACLAQSTLELRRFCWDLSLFCGQEFGFVKLSDQFVTGSSIMPNKSNPDFVELARAQHAIVQGALSELQSTLSLPSGYHRDLQLTKSPVVRAFASSLMALSISVEVVQTMEFNRQKMRDAIDLELFATDAAIDKVCGEKLSFRDAYRQPIDRGKLAEYSPEESIQRRNSPGACGDLRLADIQQRLASLKTAFQSEGPADLP